MDPYLESQPFWSVLHGSMIQAMMGELKKRVPRGYSVWSDIYVWLHEPDAETRRGKPDTFVSGTRTARQSATSTASINAPAHSILPAVRREGNKYLLIKETRSDRVITAIELLSPANKKRGNFREAYLGKRNEYLATGTNLVEIDLLRSGLRMPLGKPRPPEADYYVIVCRADEFPRTDIWPFSVREPLPEIPVPLKPEHGHVLLPSQSCLDWSYDQGPYENKVNYAGPPRVRLGKADAEWARTLVRGLGNRP
jgi:hypothetical protein